MIEITRNGNYSHLSALIGVTPDNGTDEFEAYYHNLPPQ
jgi:hypothetical protein